MELHNLNYLSEVGVGVNLAFGMFSGMRDNLFKLFDNLMGKERDKVQARLNETGNGNGKSGVAVRLDDISTAYQKYGKYITNSMVVFAISCIPILFYVLVKSALNPDKKIDDIYAYVCLFFVAGPFALCAIFHMISSIIAYVMLKIRLYRYKAYAVVVTEINSDIEPTKPTI